MTDNPDTAELNTMPALLARIEELEASEFKAIAERDEWSDLFDTICGYLGVETEYSNVRSADDVLAECADKIGELLALERQRDGELAALSSLLPTTFNPPVPDRISSREPK